MAKVNFHLSVKKLLLLGFLFVALIAIPLTVYLVQQQQETRTQAVKNTTLSLNPPSATTQVGEDLDFDVLLSPGSNQVAIIKLVIRFDSTKLSATEESFVVDPASQLSVLEGPVVGPDTLSVILSIGSDTTKVIQFDTKIGNLSFEVKDGASTTTEVAFDPTTEVNSISGGDAASENVFLSGNPATVTIEGVGGQSSPSASPSPAITQTSGNSAPVCTSLGIDVASTGVAPYTVTFSASGSDTDGTIEKAVFTFEPNISEEVATESSTANESIDVVATHTYETPSVYTASVVLTDDGGTESSSVNCSQTITVTDENGNTNTAENTTDTDNDGTGGETETTTTEETTTETTTEETTTGETVPSPLPATGPEDAVMGIGVLGGILLLIGTLLFFAL